MRTKALLGLAALAVSAITAVAQSNVYSLNIVGYVNVPMPAGNYAYVNPLDKDGTNSAAQIFSYGAQTVPDYTYVNKWTGSGYETYYYENGLTGTGWATDSSGSVELQPPVLAPGTGFFLAPGTAFTNTFVGNVFPGPGTTNTVAYAAGNLFVGSRLPVGGSVTNALWNFPAVDYLYVNKWTGSGFATYYYENGLTGTGWATDSSGSVELPAPSFNVGEGFFYNSQAGASWSQWLP